MTACVAILLLILGLPVFGLFLARAALPQHLTIFPMPTVPGALSVSWMIFALLAVFILAILIPILWRFFNFSNEIGSSRNPATSFPWWGWVSIIWIGTSWVLAWTRMSSFDSLQPHTFPMLWFGYIVMLNAVTYQRSGYCLLLHHSRFFGKLFILSTGFWWTFEYLNQYVNNWHYLNVPEIPSSKYIFYSSVSFSTVLPAVLSTYDWLCTFPRLTKPFAQWHPLPWIKNEQLGWPLLISGSLALILVGAWPTMLFPLLWIAPLCLLLGIQILRHKFTWIQTLAQGDWQPLILGALSALACGFWWEFWNFYSLVHWEYTIPYVHAFEIFAMPILGYAGYLPFGITCLAITELALGYDSTRFLKSLTPTCQKVPYNA